MSHSTWRTSPCGQRRGECREYLPEYTKEGDLILPKNWRSWVYVGSPLTRDALNNGMAGFPEYYNVYIEPGSYEIYKKTGEFPEGTIFFKELQRAKKDEAWTQFYRLLDN